MVNVDFELLKTSRQAPKSEDNLEREILRGFLFFENEILSQEIILVFPLVHMQLFYCMNSHTL